jgi:hypothetical protein
MLNWYYTAGHGMFLTEVTNELYTRVRIRLSEYIVGEDDEERAKRCMRDFSLLRQQMRLDVEALSDRPSYWRELDDEDMALLKDVGIRNPEKWGRPWHRRLRRRPDLANAEDSTSQDGHLGSATAKP